MSTQLHILEHETRVIEYTPSHIITGPIVKYTSGRIGRIINPKKLFLLRPSIYNSIITPKFINALITYFKGRQPYLFYSSFLYTTTEMGEQILHRDVSRNKLPVITVLIDIDSNIATTRIIKGSHKDLDDPYYKSTSLNALQLRNGREIVTATDRDNVIMIDSCILHHGIRSSVDTIKLELSFVPKYENDEEHDMYIQHCKDFGGPDIDQTVPECALFPLQYHA
jgi:hypothetical protein